MAVAGQALAMGLLSMVALRWVGFLGLQPVCFLIVLLVGIPVGGLLPSRIRWLRTLSLSATLSLAAGLALASATLFLVGLGAVDSEIEFPNADVPGLLRSMFLRFLVPALAFFPLFVATGLLELSAYRAGLAGLGGRSGLVYALNLLGLTLSFLAYRLLLVPLGTSGLALIGLVVVFGCALALRPRASLPLAGAAVCLGLLGAPGLEPATLAALEVKTGRSTLNGWRAQPSRVIHDAWTPHCRLTILDMQWGIAGFYEGMSYWTYTRNMPPPGESPEDYRDLDVAFARLVRPGDRVAVLGAGGGRQVAAALRAGAGLVVAVELVPEVLNVLAGPLSDAIEGIYRDPRVRLVPRNARRFLDESDETFDLIVVASVESHLGGLRALFEPSQVMFTREAFARMGSRLAPGGVLAVSKFSAVDQRATIFRQSFAQLHHLGLRTRGYVQRGGPPGPAGSSVEDVVTRGVHYLILGQNGHGSLDAIAGMDEVLRDADVEVVPNPPPAPDLPEITDDRAFATGMLIANVGLPAITAVLLALALLLLLVGAVLAWTVGQPDRRGRSLALASVAAGFNFMGLEYLIVYRLLDRLDVPLEATFLGMTAFVALAAVGGMVLAGWSSRRLFVAATVAAAALLGGGLLAPRASLVLAALGAVLTGSLFPRILVGSDSALASVYVGDAYGALWGGLCALVVPLFAGFSGHQATVAVGLFLAAWSMHRATRPCGAMG